VHHPLASAQQAERSHDADVIARRLNAERVVVLGWTRAILLQFAHPLVAAGVHDHSNFRASALASVKRLHHTIGAMLALTFGGEAERERTLQIIRGIHRRVNGQLKAAVGPFPAGTRYSAEDPALVLWVHLTLIESIVLIYDRLVQPLTEHERDAFCEASASVAIALGAEEYRVPRTWHALLTALDSAYASGRIVVGPTARELARAMLRPRGGLVARPATWTNETLAVGMLPDRIRKEYGFRWNDSRQRLFSLTMAAVQRLRRITPARLARWPQSF
jgi:uncharacterized protein (DUF2236 family)